MRSSRLACVLACAAASTSASTARAETGDDAGTSSQATFGARQAMVGEAEGGRVERLVLTGFNRVRESVVYDVLPRELPTPISDDEVEEFERRLWSLAIFDDVTVAREGAALRVEVREKWTLVPTLELETSRTIRDSYALVSLTEYNTFGRAQELGAYVAYGERAVSSEVWWQEQPSSARRLSFEAGASWVGSGFTFESSSYAWERRRTGGRFGLRFPFPYGQRFRFALLPAVYREALISPVPEGEPGGLAPGIADGTYGGLGVRATWDAYSWNDLTPSGVRLTLEVTPGALLRQGPFIPRHNVLAQALAAIPLSSHVVVLANVVGEAGSDGDPNHSALLGNVSGYRFGVGSLGGVRGLTDNLYRNTAHAYGNLEVRGAVTFAPRWHLQGVAFVDGGAFASMNALGVTGRATSALSTGIGLRLLPTAIASLVPRIDTGRRLLPTEAWFVTFSLAQYF